MSEWHPADPQIFLRQPRLPLRRRLDPKGLADMGLAAMGLLFAAPLLAVVACAIRLESRGPAVFRQRRRGLAGEPFRIFKFRTMCVQEDGAQISQAREQDPRVTGMGFWLRRTSIDELPQLVNVLRGEMSLVGPRPHAIAHDEYYGPLIEGYALRHRVKPGLTGWAQVNGARGPTPDLGSMETRIQLDVWYVQNRSLALDAAIILKTLSGAAWGKGAL